MENKNLVFLDCTSDKNHISIKNRAIGASEYQFYQLIENFSKKNHHPIYCYNLCEEGSFHHNIHYNNQKYLINYHFHENCRIIIQRFFPWEQHITSRIENQKIFFWIHDIPDYMVFVGRNDNLIDYYKSNREKFQGYLREHFIYKKNITFILNSYHCKNLLVDFLKSFDLELEENRMMVIYNILYENELRSTYETQIPLQKNKIVYASAWTKGIEDIIRLFEYIHSRNPHFVLELMNPGYGMEKYVHLKQDLLQRFPNNIKIHEALSKKQYSEVIKSALCVLSSKFNETYGCVFAESYYLGTPVIADFRSGAVKEIIDNNFIVNYDDPNEVYTKINYLVGIRDDKKIHLSKKFALNNVFPIWTRTLE